MTDICYKVVLGYPGGGLSVSTKNSAAVHYSTTEFVAVPKYLRDLGNHLLVFATLEDAKAFLKETLYSPHEYQIWSCECKESVPLPMFSNPFLLDKGEIFNVFGAFPSGTISFKRVKLIERIL